MSQHVYEQLRGRHCEQGPRERRFIAVIFERNPELAEDDLQHLPTMFGPMRYIDMSTAERYDQNYDQLLRFLLDKPEFVAPQLGRVPSHLLGEAPTPTAGQAQAQTIRRLLDQGKPAGNAWRDYLERVEEVIRDMPPAVNTENGQVNLNFQAMTDEVKGFISVRDDFISLLYHSVRQGNIPMSQMIAFFERMISISDQLQEVHRTGNAILSPVYFYHAEFVLMELVLYMTAVLVNEEQSEALKEFTDHTFFIEKYQEMKPVNFTALRRIPEQETIERAYNLASGQNWISPIGAWLRERVTLQRVPEEALSQAELLLFLKSAMVARSEGLPRSSIWYCSLATYWGREKPLPLICRWPSRKRLQPWLSLFDARDADDLRKQLRAAFPENSFHKYFRDEWHSVSLEGWLNIDKWGTLN